MAKTRSQIIVFIWFFSIFSTLIGCGDRLPLDASPARILAETRPDNGRAMRCRGCAHWRLGDLRLAARELRLAVVAAPDEPAGHVLLAELERRLGNLGRQLWLLQEAHRLTRGKDATAARALARALVQRAGFRLDRRIGLFQIAAARRDIERAVTLDPDLAARGCPLLAEANRLGEALATVSGYDALHAAAGDPFRDTVACPGPPRGVGLSVPAVPVERCALTRPNRYLDNLGDRFPLWGCFGAQLALRLERHGCVTAARAVWQRMVKEAPQDPRWALMLARSFVATGQPGRAEPRLQVHIFFSPNRARATLRAAKLMLAGGYSKRAARLAVRSTLYPGPPGHVRRAAELVARAGMPDKAKQLLDINQKNQIH